MVSARVVTAAAPAGKGSGDGRNEIRKICWGRKLQASWRLQLLIASVSWRAMCLLREAQEGVDSGSKNWGHRAIPQKVSWSVFPPCKYGGIIESPESAGVLSEGKTGKSS